MRARWDRGSPVRRPGDDGRVLPATVLVGLLVGSVAVAGCAGPSPDDDAALVFCLGAPQRARLAEAAVVLGSARPARIPDQVERGGRAVTLETFRGQDPAAFDRACAAIRPADQPGPVSAAVISTVTGLVNVVLGAVLALVSTTTVNRSARRHTAAGGVGTASRGLVRTVGAFAAAVDEGTAARPDRADLLEKVSALDAALRAARAAGLPVGMDVLARLDDVAGQVTRSWPTAVDADVQSRAQRLDESVRAVGEDAAVVAAHADRSWLDRILRRGPGAAS